MLRELVATPGRAMRSYSSERQACSAKTRSTRLKRKSEKVINSVEHVERVKRAASSTLQSPQAAVPVAFRNMRRRLSRGNDGTCRVPWWASETILPCLAPVSTACATGPHGACLPADISFVTFFVFREFPAWLWGRCRMDPETGTIRAPERQVRACSMASPACAGIQPNVKWPMSRRRLSRRPRRHPRRARTRSETAGIVAATLVLQAAGELG